MRRLLPILTLLACALLRGEANASDPLHVPLLDQSGRAFTLASLRGNPSVITFLATRCRDACPISNAVFSALAARLEREHVPATLLTMTLDPEYDTPFVMARAAKQFEAQTPRWRFASGKAADIRAVLAFFGIQPAERSEVHGNGIYILDSQGRLLRSSILSSNSVEEIDSELRSYEESRRTPGSARSYEKGEPLWKSLKSSIPKRLAARTVHPA